MLPLPSQLHHCGTVVFKIDLNWPKHADCLGSLLLNAVWRGADEHGSAISQPKASKSYHSSLGLLINSRSLCDWLLCFVSQESDPLSCPFLFGLAICMLGHRKILMFMLLRTCRCFTAANRFSIFAGRLTISIYIYCSCILIASWGNAVQYFFLELFFLWQALPGHVNLCDVLEAATAAAVWEIMINCWTFRTTS